jgi:hypothetical protein
LVGQRSTFIAVSVLGIQKTTSGSRNQSKRGQIMVTL